MFYDDGNQVKDHRHGNGRDGDRFYLYEKCTDRTDLYYYRLGVSFIIFLLAGKNRKKRRGRWRGNLLDEQNREEATERAVCRGGNDSVILQKTACGV